MRGKSSVFVQAARLEAALAHRATPPRPRYDFAAFADQELEALAAVAEKIEPACREPAWTADAPAVLTRLEGKLVATKGAQQ
jgi:hypothetical protein